MNYHKIKFREDELNLLIKWLPDYKWILRRSNDTIALYKHKPKKDRSLSFVPDWNDTPYVGTSEHIEDGLFKWLELDQPMSIRKLLYPDLPFIQIQSVWDLDDAYASVPLYTVMPDGQIKKGYWLSSIKVFDAKAYRDMGLLFLSYEEAVAYKERMLKRAVEDAVRYQDIIANRSKPCI